VLDVVRRITFIYNGEYYEIIRTSTKFFDVYGDRERPVIHDDCEL
jgi:hypothetical protein